MGKRAFIDKVEIIVVAGMGGAGMASFLRMRGQPKGGPNGGDGGEGGSVYVLADNSINTLLEFKYRRLIEAGNGSRGGTQDRSGSRGDDVELHVPIGTLIFDAETGGKHCELVTDGERVLLAKGGNGGWGNSRFKTSTNRAPRQIGSGEKGEKREFRMELRVMADIGLVGLPNAGKSALLKAMSAAQPKVADYPFTTLKPHLGVVCSKDYSTAVMADIPGLIEGAADGAGLGNHFLMHISRTRVLFHVVDIAKPGGGEIAFQGYQMILSELTKASNASNGLLEKPHWLILNKSDLLEEDGGKAVVSFFRKHIDPDIPLFLVSAKTGNGLDELKNCISRHISNESTSH